MKLTLQVTMDNAAFAPEVGGQGMEVARILRKLAGDIENVEVFHLGTIADLRDATNVKVGTVNVEK